MHAVDYGPNDMMPTCVAIRGKHANYSTPGREDHSKFDGAALSWVARTGGGGNRNEAGAGPSRFTSAPISPSKLVRG